MRYKGNLTLEQAKNLILTNCPVNQGVIGSYDLLMKCGRGKYGTSNLNYAYWVLVGSGELIRVPAGVYKK